MQGVPPPLTGEVELNAVLLQVAVTVGLTAICYYLYRRYRKPYIGGFALGWGLYILRLGAIAVFARTADWIWLYWHQVVTGWTALALLGAALAFARRMRRPRLLLAAGLFPLAWSYVAIYQLDNFLLAALPAVLFLSLVTLGTGWLFLRHWLASRSPGALNLAIALVLWGLHHLDYPFLRARGAWVPWGYYLDIVFTLAVGAGILILVLEDLRDGLLQRTGELERLSRRMLAQHEEERRRLSLHLHDETAQVFTAVKLQLGVLREGVDPATAERIGRLVSLVDDGIASIRNVTNDLRPALLDDMGLRAALLSLARSSEERLGMSIGFDAPEQLPRLRDDAEVALFRAVQESLANAAQHSGGSRVEVAVAVTSGFVELTIDDDGRGFPEPPAERQERVGHLGLAGMRERVTALGGSLELGRSAQGGARVRIRLPLQNQTSAGVG